MLEHSPHDRHQHCLASKRTRRHFYGPWRAIGLSQLSLFAICRLAQKRLPGLRLVYPRTRARFLRYCHIHLPLLQSSTYFSHLSCCPRFLRWYRLYPSVLELRMLMLDQHHKYYQSAGDRHQHFLLRMKFNGLRQILTSSSLARLS